MTLTVTAIAAALLGLWHVKLSLGVISLRRHLKVSIGDGGHEELQRAIRAQANNSEYVPISLILLLCLELNNAPIWLTGLLATALVIGRVMHAQGIRTAAASFRPRVLGMQLTLYPIALLGIANLLWLILRTASLV